jgi:hypothetical protein
MKEGEGELPVLNNDQNMSYLGLNVHAEKRMDLASKNDPNATTSGESNDLPLVWHAAKLGAKDTVNYLTSDRPFLPTSSMRQPIPIRRLSGSGLYSARRTQR